MSAVTQGICHGVLGWSQVEQMTSHADPATVPLANSAGPLLSVAGDPDHTAVPVPLQQMPCEKLASHTYSQDHRSPWPVQTAYILHIGVCIGKTVTMYVPTEGNNPKILNLDL